MQEASPSHPPLGRWLVLLMAITTGLAVASNYYAQPLLHTIAENLELSSFAQAGIIVTVAQMGFALGLLFLVPLGDLFEQRRMILIMMLLTAIGLLISANAVGLPMLLVGTAITGTFSVVAQMLVPFAATMATPEERGKVVGTVMSGLLLGILLARAVAGALSTLGNWRTVYWVAAVLMLVNAIVLYRALPSHRHSAGLSYARLLVSIASLFVRYPLYRLRTALGFLSFGMFSAFWTSIAFLLSAPPFGFSDATIGLFSLAGAVGALATRQAGKLADRGQSRLTTWLGLTILVVAWGLLGAAPYQVIVLLVGIVLLDLASQAVHVTNMHLIYSLDSGARNRLNAGYMTSYFLGGALGSVSSAALFDRFGWSGVVGLGLAMALAACVLWGAYGRRVPHDA